MSRWPRVHVPHGVYYLCLSACEKRELFPDLDDIAAFERSVPDATEVSGVSVLAYVWTRRAARFVVQAGSLPLGDFVHRLCSTHSRHLNARHGWAGAVFQSRHEVFVHQETYVFRAVRAVHWVPMYERLTDDPAEYPHSSHRVYLGLADTPWVSTAYVQDRLLPRDEHFRGGVYAEYMQRHSPRDQAQLDRNPPWWPRCADADLAVYAQSASAQSQVAGSMGLDAILEWAAALLSVSRDEILTSSRSHRAVRARALITWKATTSGVASLRAVATYLKVDKSTLSTGLARWRRKEPQLFQVSMRTDPQHDPTLDSGVASEE